MSFVENYTEWKAAVQAASDELRAVDRYLNDAGKERKAVMETLLDFANYCDTASELLEWIESREGMNRHDSEQLSSIYACSPIRRLKKIVEGTEKAHGG